MEISMHALALVILYTMMGPNETTSVATVSLNSGINLIEFSDWVM